MILEEEQKGRELKQEIAEMQGKDLCHQQPTTTLNQNIRHPTYQPSHKLPSKA
jgi:hypothetical protein